jgi:hypothetical protein
MVSVEESEKLGNALNILEALNKNLLKYSPKRIPNRYWRTVFTHLKIEKVIKFIDEVAV